VQSTKDTLERRCTHTARILAKAGTERQTELIRRFFETIVPGLPASAGIKKYKRRLNAVSSIRMTPSPETQVTFDKGKDLF
jgi:hypothetical protein